MDEQGTPRPIRRLLIANRGEIARRITRTAREMGIATIAVYAEPDREAPFVAEADVAVPLAGSASSETYLDIGRMVEAARLAGADAVHPGYGFLAENAAFAQACVDAGLVFVGPPPAAIRAMGSKVEAKRLMRGAGVPVLPHVEASGLTETQLVHAAGQEGFPLLVKASAGGGGKGMHIVRDARELVEAVRSGEREALSAFGDGAVFLERYLERARHIEVQVFADHHGNVCHLFERECSVQRRHQKVIEESPSPVVDPDLRERMAAAAVAAARAIGYTNAGTVEFLYWNGEFFFLEMNTRLQVEHPVTEAVTGLDLVRLQLLVARGERLPFYEGEVTQEGHAIEARLYAEDPAAGFLPSTGTLLRYGHAAVPGVRVDDGVVAGYEVSAYFDPMLAKLIVHAPTREEAAARLAAALSGMRIHGVRTNRDLLVRVLRHPEFLAGEVDTELIERHPELLEPLVDAQTRRVYAVAAALAGERERRATARVLRTIPSGWRNVRSQLHQTALEAEGERIRVAYAFDRAGTELRLDGESHELRIVAANPERMAFELDGLRHTLDVHHAGDVYYVNGPAGQVDFRELPRFAETDELEAAGSCTAPVPGLVVAVRVQEGERVSKGQKLAVLEAMKMELPVEAPHDGVVVRVAVSAGEQVAAGQVLVMLDGQPAGDGQADS